MQTKLAKGFTLIEVVIATFIVGMSLIAVVGTIQSITQQTSRLEEKFIADLVANNFLTELQLKSQWPEIGEQDLEAEMAGREWFAKIKVEATEVETLRRIEINVGLDNDEDISSTFVLGFVSASSAIATRPVDWLKLETKQESIDDQNPQSPETVNNNGLR